jgi:hypothetical protein
MSFLASRFNCGEFAAIKTFPLEGTSSPVAATRIAAFAATRIVAFAAIRIAAFAATQAIQPGNSYLYSATNRVIALCHAGEESPDSTGQCTG